MNRPTEPVRARARSLAAALFLTAAVLSPAGAETLPGFEPTLPSAGLLGSGLLNLSRFDVSHSLSYGVTSSSLGSQSGGLWLTEIGYQASRPLRFSLDVGMTIDPANGFVGQNSFFLHSFAMDYQPSRSFQLHVSYVNVPAAASGILGLTQTPGLGWGSRNWGNPAGLGR